MILCIGERAHKPEWKVDDRAMAHVDEIRYRESWCDPKKQLRMILGCSAMTHGPTRANLFKLYKLPESTCIRNLLWPSGDCGAWHEKEAVQCAETVKHWLEQTGKLTDEWEEPPREVRVRLVLLLGRNVTNAFFPGESVPFGHVFEFDRLIGSAPITGVCVPHPSGRSRTMNDEAEAERLRSIVQKHLPRGGKAR